MPAMEIATELGTILLRMHDDVAPTTAAHIAKLAAQGVYEGACFYRSDFVIQMGAQRPDGSAIPNANAALAVNESQRGLSNTRGTAAVAHWDVPDCGNSEFFINLQDNAHLDSAYGGYAVFASVALDDSASWATMGAIRDAVLQGARPRVDGVRVS